MPMPVWLFLKQTAEDVTSSDLITLSDHSDDNLVLLAPNIGAEAGWLLVGMWSRPITFQALTQANEWAAKTQGRVVIYPVNPKDPPILHTWHYLDGDPDRVAGLTQWLGGVPEK